MNREDTPVIIVDSIAPELWYEEKQVEIKKHKCKKCKKPITQCNCNYRGKKG